MLAGEKISFPVGLRYRKEGDASAEQWREFVCIGFEPYSRAARGTRPARNMSLAVIEGQCCAEGCDNIIRSKVAPYFPFAIKREPNGQARTTGAILPYCPEHWATTNRFPKFESSGKPGRPTADKTPMKAWIRSIARSKIGMTDIKKSAAEAPEHIRIQSGYDAITDQDKYIARLVADMVHDSLLLLDGKGPASMYQATPLRNWAEVLAHCKYGNFFTVPWEQIRDATEESALDLVEQSMVQDTWIMRAEQINYRRLVFGVPELPLWEIEGYEEVRSMQADIDSLIVRLGPMPSVI